MSNDKKAASEPSDFRRRAEEQLQANAAEAGFARTDDETHRLLHELQVHRIELEMQNAELRQARDEAETALEKYTDLYDFAPVGYLTLDPDGVVRAANLTAAGILGIERSRLIGRVVALFLAKDERPIFTRFLLGVFGRRAKDVCEVALLNEAEGKAPIFVQIEAVAAIGENTCRIAVLDITERRWIGDKLRISEHQLAESQRLVHLGSWQWDSIADTITGSDEFYRIFGRIFSSYEQFLELVHPDDRNRVNEAVQDTLDRQTPYNIYYRIVLPDGTLRIIHAQGEAIADNTCSVVRMVGTAQDVTERKQLEETLEILHTDLASRAAELESANIELEAFNYSVSHDLRSPLTIINSYCQVLQELCGSTLNKECRGYIQDIYEGSLSMSRLIDTLLNFSRITRVDMRHEKVYLSNMAEVVAMGLKLSAPERRVEFRIAEGIMTDGDANLWRIVLENLIGNAWKYTGRHEEAIIEFGVTDVDRQPACFVRDNGPGFDMAHADRLFKPFQRLSGTEVEGHGIGLATVERIVRRHGGRVWAEGEPGKGATFYFTLG